MARKTPKDALKAWMDLPTNIKQKILGNVYCVQCRDMIMIRADYGAELDGGGVVLRGFCSVCGHKVARVIEH